jgi:hypothetical protein
VASPGSGQEWVVCSCDLGNEYEFHIRQGIYVVAK